MRWLSVDPGDTTGWALWLDERLLESGQTPNWEFVDDVAHTLAVGAGDTPLLPEGPKGWANLELLLIEDFVLYPWELREGNLDFDSVETARVIGGLLTIARLADIPVVLQGADIKDGAIAGGAEALFVRPLHENRHANDAIMHGTYYVQTKLLDPATSRVEDGRLVSVSPAEAVPYA